MYNKFITITIKMLSSLRNLSISNIQFEGYQKNKKNKFTKKILIKKHKKTLRGGCNKECKIPNLKIIGKGIKIITKIQ